MFRFGVGPYIFSNPELIPPALVTEAGNTPIFGIANSLFYKGNLIG
jgi:hypothetical protein